MPDSVSISKLTVPAQILIGAISSTAIIVFVIITSLNDVRDEVRISNSRIDTSDNNAKIMELKFEYLRLDVEKLKIDIENERRAIKERQ